MQARRRCGHRCRRRAMLASSPDKCSWPAAGQAWQPCWSNMRSTVLSPCHPAVQLPSLIHLDLSFSSLHGPLPQSRLCSLHTLTLSGNQVWGGRHHPRAGRRPQGGVHRRAVHAAPGLRPCRQPASPGHPAPASSPARCQSCCSRACTTNPSRMGATCFVKPCICEWGGEVPPLLRCCRKSRQLKRRNSTRLPCCACPGGRMLCRSNLSRTGVTGPLPELPDRAAVGVMDLSHTPLGGTLPASWPRRSMYLTLVDLTNASIR